jgi:hypothetical protein
MMLMTQFHEHFTGALTQQYHIAGFEERVSG